MGALESAAARELQEREALAGRIAALEKVAQSETPRDRLPALQRLR